MIPNTCHLDQDRHCVGAQKDMAVMFVQGQSKGHNLVASKVDFQTTVSYLAYNSCIHISLGSDHVISSPRGSMLFFETTHQPPSIDELPFVTTKDYNSSTSLHRLRNVLTQSKNVGSCQNPLACLDEFLRLRCERLSFWRRSHPEHKRRIIRKNLVVLLLFLLDTTLHGFYPQRVSGNNVFHVVVARILRSRTGIHDWFGG